MADLSRAATAEASVAGMLRALCGAAAQALDVDGAAVMAHHDDRNVFVQADRDFLQPLERLQETLQLGPCADCVLSGAPVVTADLTRDPRWVQFQAVASTQDVSAMVAVPLISRDRTWGVLDLYRRAAGDWTQQELQAAQALADVAVAYMVMAHDRDAARDAQLELARRAMHDDLTGLPNRALLFDRLDHALATASRRAAGVAVVFLDLDLFKGINDTFGHTAADDVLLQIALRLSTTLRGEDTLARFAGDEFVLVCEGLVTERPEAFRERVGALTARLQRTLHRPIRIGQVDVVVSASIGVAITTDTMRAQELVAEADTAMYAAKQSGRGRVRIRDHTAGSAIGYAGRLERDLAGALDGGELRVHYQPLVYAGSRGVGAVEALLRWHRPGSGVLPAAAFIDVAVKSGVIHAIGRWVISQACRQLATWTRDLPAAIVPATTYVNLSGREITDGGLPAVIASTLAEHRLRPEQLGLEIAEQDLGDPDAWSCMQQLQLAGHPLSIDDFGTGHSSLSRLLDLPVHLAKIDKSFVAGIPGDRRRVAFVRGVLQMTRALDIAVVAEGVETAAQAQHLTAAGCQLLQGYHLSPPQTGEQLAATWHR